MLSATSSVSLPAPGTLYIVSLPIGNPEDITLRALRVLREVSLIVAEEARLLTDLLADYPPATEIVSLRPRHGAPARAAALTRLQTGGDVALVSDCGTPVSVDPGLKLVQVALQQGSRVTAVPGATACFTALVISGFPPTPFTFFGYPPRRLSERTEFFARLGATSETVVLYESPRYLQSTLTALNRQLGNQAKIVVGCDLTSTAERVFRGTISAAVTEFADRRPGGAYTLVVSGDRASISS